MSINETKAACLELALSVTKGQRGANHMTVANDYLKFAKSGAHLRALSLAVRFPVSGEETIQTAQAYLDYFSDKPAPKVAEVAPQDSGGEADQPATETPAPATEAKTTGQAARPRKTRRKAGARKGA